ncbi:MAG: MarR family transcriptional regulator [Rhodoglobus sp.]|jgi:DNA-binding MarR family transcriptional regulator|nr:MarR family transcriptional regulator [Rhodoglobus sp.]
MTESDDDRRERAALDLENGISQIYQRSRARVRHLAERFEGELQPLGFGILRYIIINGPLRAGDIGTGLGIDKAAVSRQLAQLKQLGLIASAPDPADKRATLIEASEAARSALEAFRVEVGIEYRAALASWPTDEIADLARLLGRFNESFD